MNENSKLLSMAVLVFILMVGVTLLIFVNKVYSLKEVYITNTFVPEGQVIDENNFMTLMAKITVSKEIWKELNLLEANEVNQKRIIGRIFKYNREKGDFVRIDNLEIDAEKDSLKYKLYKLSSDANGEMLLPIFVNLPKENLIQTKGVGKYQDYVRISFFRNYKSGDKAVTKLITRYKNVPIIDFTREGDYITSLVLALPAELAHKYELEKREANGVVISFNPFNFKSLKDSYSGVQTSLEIETEYEQNKIYDLKDIFENKK